MKKEILMLMAKASKAMAVKTGGCASYFGFHQPKEPATLKQLKK